MGEPPWKWPVEVFAEDYLTGDAKPPTRHYLAFVAVDSQGKPGRLPGLIIEKPKRNGLNARLPKKRGPRD
jgi:acyl-CoA hydrolase